MGRSYLCEFKKLFLLNVTSRKEEACGGAITHGLQRQTGCLAVLGAVQIALFRLDENGLDTSTIEAPTPARRGRRKRLFCLTAYGGSIPAQMRLARGAWWQLIPQRILSSSPWTRDRYLSVGSIKMERRDLFQNLTWEYQEIGGDYSSNEFKKVGRTKPGGVTGAIL